MRNIRDGEDLRRNIVRVCVFMEKLTEMVRV